MANTTTNTITITEGKSDFQVKSAKTFRNIMAKYHVACFALADLINGTNQRIKCATAVIDSDKAELAKLENGDTMGVLRTKDVIESEIKAQTDYITAQREALATASENQRKSMEDAYALVTEDVYNAYVAHMTDDTTSDFGMAIAKFLSDNGVTPCEDTILAIRNSIGLRKNASRAMQMTERHTSTYKYGKAFKDLFLGALCDHEPLRKTFNVYKWTTVLTSKKK